MSKPPLVIYHADCFDGFTAAWAFNKLTLRRGEWQAPIEFHAAHYGDAPPDCAGRDVWVLDFSYPREAMKALILQSRRTVVCDHHATAKANLEGLLDEIDRVVQRKPNDRIVFDMDRSGAGITWDVITEINQKAQGFRKPSSRHWLIDYVEDRDLGRWALPFSREVSATVAATPMTFEAWDKLADGVMEDAAHEGEAIVKYIAQYGEKATAEARMEVIGGHTVPCMNIAYMNCTEHIGKLLDKYPESLFAASYFRRKDGKWQFSLRSRPVGEAEAFDVAKLAHDLFEGGGHPRAAGFEADVLPWQFPVPKYAFSAEDLKGIDLEKLEPGHMIPVVGDVNPIDHVVLDKG